MSINSPEEFDDNYQQIAVDEEEAKPSIMEELAEIEALAKEISEPEEVEIKYPDSFISAEEEELPEVIK